MSDQVPPVPPVPPDESIRLEDLISLQLLDTDPEDEFDRITRLARILFRTRVAALSLVDEKRQWFKSTSGLNITETSRDDAFCAHTILQDKPLIVLNTEQDERFAANPLVTAGPNIRFYAGAPLRTKSGSKVGSLCVIDDKPRDSWSAVEGGLLADLAALVSAQIQTRETEQEHVADREELTKFRARFGAEQELDALTGLPDRRSMHLLIEQAKHLVNRTDRFLALVYIDIDGCSEVNRAHGEAAGDKLLQIWAQRLQSAIRSNDYVLRIGGDQFLVLLPGLEFTSHIERPIQKLLHLGSQPVGITEQVEVRTTMSLGVSFYPHCGVAAVDLLAEAKRSMLAAKAAGGNCSVISVKGKELQVVRAS